MENYRVYILLCLVIAVGCFQFRSTPDKPMVVYYRNRTNVEFRWDWTLGSGEVVFLVKIRRYRKNHTNTETVLATYFTSGSNNIDNKYTLTVSNTGNEGYASFVIKDLTNQGQGVNVMNENEIYIYKIEVDERTQAKDYNDEVELNVFRIPFITTYPRNQTASTGATVNFECAADGKPKPNITWEKIGTSDLLSSGSPLTLTNFNVSEVGVYKCVARGVGIEEVTTTTALVQFATCESGCKKAEMDIEFTELQYSSEYQNNRNPKYTKLKSQIEHECLTVYALKNKVLFKCEVLRFRRGSVIAEVELGSPTNYEGDVKQPLLEAISYGIFAGHPVKNDTGSTSEAIAVRCAKNFIIVYIIVGILFGMFIS